LEYYGDDKGDINFWRLQIIGQTCKIVLLT